MKDILCGQNWNLVEGDCIEVMNTMPEACVDLAVFSPPFSSMFSYTSEAADLGNDEHPAEIRLHFSFMYRQLARVVKPGRVVMVHVMQIPRLKRSGGQGLMDFRGLNIRLGERAGLVYEYDWAVTKNPQAQAIRTHAHELQFTGMERDRAKCRGALPDYLIKFRAPGENAVPVDSEGCVHRNDWIQWAEAFWPWSEISATDTLNVRGTKGEGDTKHICPLQLPVIRRLVRLYTNPGEIVFSPFAGIGSEGYEALKLGRRFYGIELKPEYAAEAVKNLTKAEEAAQFNSKTLFDMAVA